MNEKGKPHSTWDRLEEYLDEYRDLFIGHSSLLIEHGDLLKGILCAITSRGVPFTIHVVEVDTKRKGETPMPPPVDHMPPIQLPSSSIRAKLNVVNPRLANGSRVTSVTWTTSDEAQLPLEAIPDDTVKDEAGAEVLDPTDNLPLSIFAVFANTPLDQGEGTVTVKAPGMADCDIVVKYSDPALGHFAITGVEAPEA